MLRDAIREMIHPERAPAFTLRPARPTDHDAIAGIWHQGASLPGVGPRLVPSRIELRERLEEAVAAGLQVTVAAGDSGILGFVAIRPEDAVLAELFVRPDQIGLGIGRALLAQAMTAMPDGFTLYTRSSNARARFFYKQAGLVALGHGSHPRTGDPVTHYGYRVVADLPPGVQQPA